MSRRVLVTGLGSFWGGRVAAALEADPLVDVIVGLDTRPPGVPLERTEFVRCDQSYSVLSRVVKATRVDTIIHTFLVLDATTAGARLLHEQNVIGTMNLLAAAGAPGSCVRQVVVKSSSLVYGCTRRDPTWFREDMTRVSSAHSDIERSLLEVETYVRDFAEDNPQVTVTLLRFANVIGREIDTPITKALRLPAVPCIFGFDPLFQFVDEVDVIRAIEFVTRNGLAGIFNVAGEGRLPWSEVAAMCGKRLVPLPPVATEMAARPLARLNVELPRELLELLRYGRGVDPRRLVDAGFAYSFTSAGAVQNLAGAIRMERVVRSQPTAYTYNADVEQFLRHSPVVLDDAAGTPT